MFTTTLRMVATLLVLAGVTGLTGLLPLPAGPLQTHDAQPSIAAHEDSPEVAGIEVSPTDGAEPLQISLSSDDGVGSPEDAWVDPAIFAGLDVLDDSDDASADSDELGAESDDDGWADTVDLSDELASVTWD